MDDATTRRSTGLRISCSSSTAVPEIVDADIAGDFIHALTDTDFGGEMDHAVDAPESGRHRFGIANVAPDQFDVRR